MDCILPHHVLSSRSELGVRGAVRYGICVAACLQLPGLRAHVCKQEIEDARNLNHSLILEVKINLKF